MQSFSDGLQLGCLDVLGAPFDLYQTLTSYVTTINLKHTNKICLAKPLCLADFSDILTDTKILFDFLFRTNTLSGLNLVHLDLFYSQ